MRLAALFESGFQFSMYKEIIYKSYVFIYFSVILLVHQDRVYFRMVGERGQWHDGTEGCVRHACQSHIDYISEYIGKG